MKTPQTVVPPKLDAAIKEEIRELQHPRSRMIRHLDTLMHKGITATLRIVKGFRNLVSVTICVHERMYDVALRGFRHVRTFTTVTYNFDGTRVA